jgi:hypothetical protein
MQATVLIAIGGNALLRTNELATAGAERLHVADTCRAIADVVSNGWRAVITHERAAGRAALVRSTCRRRSYPPTGSLRRVRKARSATSTGAGRTSGPRCPSWIATVVTQVVVDRHDPAFARPTKPIGPFYAHAEMVAASPRLDTSSPAAWMAACGPVPTARDCRESVIRAPSMRMSSSSPWAAVAFQSFGMGTASRVSGRGRQRSHLGVAREAPAGRSIGVVTTSTASIPISARLTRARSTM